MTGVMGLVNDWIVAVMDLPLGWSLRWSMSAALVIAAVATSAVLTLLRLATTDQGNLKRCSLDKKRLKALIRQAKRQKDKQAVKRHRATVGMIATGRMSAELKPLLASLIPVIFLGTWCFARLGFVPPTGDEPVTVQATFPVLSIGKLVHIVPQAGLGSDNGWIQRVARATDAAGNVTSGVASWQISAVKRDRPYVLRFQHEGQTIEKELIIDGVHYGPPVETYPDQPITAVALVMEPFRPFGVIGVIEAWRVSPWIVGYLLVTIPFVLILKRALGIY